MKRVFFIAFILSLFFIENSFSQIDLRNVEFNGWVHQKGKGIANVPVTDGYNVVTTDSEGYYTLLSNATADYVYITIPSGYNVPMKKDSPCFFRAIEDKTESKQTIDFELEKSVYSDDKHVAIAWADPQVHRQEYVVKCGDAAIDVKHYLKEKYPDVPAFGIVCGDIVGDKPELYSAMKSEIRKSDIPFFYVPGNHDMNLYVRTDQSSRERFKKNFGPDFYSFNRGKIHYVMLSNSYYMGRDYFYTGYLSERQLNWLQQDLALVPEGSTVVVSFHIPTRLKGHVKPAMTTTFQNAAALYNMLKPFNAHLFSGHMHNNDNFVISDKLYEHNHAAICGIFWQGPDCADGTPPGYGVYVADGDKFTWQYKSIGFSDDYQFRAYPAGVDANRPDEIIALVWNHDPTWKVYWYEDGKKMGEMVQYTGNDPQTTNFIVNNKASFEFDWIWTSETDHLFSAKPISSKSKIKVEVIDRFGRTYSQDIY